MRAICEYLTKSDEFDDSNFEAFTADKLNDALEGFWLAARKKQLLIVGLPTRLQNSCTLKRINSLPPACSHKKREISRVWCQTLDISCIL